MLSDHGLNVVYVVVLMPINLIITLHIYFIFTADKTSTEVVDFQGDVCNTKDVAKALAGATTVYHTAALIDVSSFPDYAKLEEINVKGMIFLST